MRPECNFTAAGRKAWLGKDHGGIRRVLAALLHEKNSNNSNWLVSKLRLELESIFSL
jgi:hypothetical protein